MVRAIKEKELENQFNMKQEETEETMKNIKTAALKEVEHRRVNLKKIIAEMREKQRRKTISLANRLRLVKFNMAQKMNSAYKKGDIAFCVKIKKGEPKETRRHYCVANFSENILNFQECMSTDDFCHFCCDSEYGDFHQQDRKRCYNDSCVIPNSEQEKTNESDVLVNSLIG